MVDDAVDKLEAGMVSKSVGSVEVLISFDVVLVVRIHEGCQIGGFRDSRLSFGFPEGTDRLNNRESWDLSTSAGGINFRGRSGKRAFW